MDIKMAKVKAEVQNNECTAQNECDKITIFIRISAGGEKEEGVKKAANRRRPLYFFWNYFSANLFDVCLYDAFANERY